MPRLQSILEKITSLGYKVNPDSNAIPWRFRALRLRWLRAAL